MDFQRTLSSGEVVTIQEDQRKNLPGDQKETKGVVSIARTVLGKPVSPTEAQDFFTRKNDLLPQDDPLADRRRLIAIELKREAETPGFSSVRPNPEASSITTPVTSEVAPIKPEGWSDICKSNSRVRDVIAHKWGPAWYKAAGPEQMYKVDVLRPDSTIFDLYMESAHGLSAKEKIEKGEPDVSHDISFAEWFLERLSIAVETGLNTENSNLRRRASIELFEAAQSLLDAITTKLSINFNKPTCVRSNSDGWFIIEELAEKLQSGKRPDFSIVQPTLVVQPQLLVDGKVHRPGHVA